MEEERSLGLFSTEPFKSSRLELYFLSPLSKNTICTIAKHAANMYVCTHGCGAVAKTKLLEKA